MASRPALADDPLLAVGDRESGRQDDTFAKLRTLGQKGTDRYLFYFQHYPALLTAQQRFHALKPRPAAPQLLALQQKGLVPAYATE